MNEDYGGDGRTGHDQERRGRHKTLDEDRESETGHKEEDQHTTCTKYTIIGLLLGVISIVEGITFYYYARRDLKVMEANL